jgi:hypothetical protein
MASGAASNRGANNSMAVIIESTPEFQVRRPDMAGSGD